MPATTRLKYFSYREAWDRITKAQGDGYYLEAVTLEESILADRLISFLFYIGAIEVDTQLEKHSFGQLIKQWMELVPEPIPTKDFPDLRVAVNEWRKRRNKIVHGMVKSVPGTDPEDVVNFLEEAKFVASKGAALARAVSEWGKKMKRQCRVAECNSTSD